MYGAWSERREAEERGRWERTRMECMCLLQPYSRSVLRPVDVMRFPWDSQEEALEEACKRTESREEVMERYRKAREARGLT